MKKEKLAELINGAEYGSFPSKEILEKARESNLVFITGRSDDILSFDGAILDEVSACNGVRVTIDKCGIRYPWDSVPSRSEEQAQAYFERKKLRSAQVNASWDDSGSPCWYISSNMPYADFMIVEDGKPFCRGIVIDLKAFDSYAVVEVFDVGDQVVCDICSKDFTNSNATGGILFGSHGVCPECLPSFMESVRKHGEERYIVAKANEGETFKDFIIKIRGGNNKVTIMSGDLF